MDAVALTVNYGRYKATIHYVSCRYFTGYHTHANRAIPLSFRMQVCKVCNPSPEDIVTIARDIQWVEHKADAMSMLSPMPLDDYTEKQVERTQANGTRIRVDRRGDW